MDTKTILVVDDDQDVLELLEKRLISEHYQVIAANRASEALRKARENIPDLILMDIVLPDMDGAEAIRLLKEDMDTRKIPVLFLSGIVKDGATEGENFEVNVGGQSYQAIPKPFTFPQLLTEIKNLIEN